MFIAGQDVANTASHFVNWLVNRGSLEEPYIDHFSDLQRDGFTLTSPDRADQIIEDYRFAMSGTTSVLHDWFLANDPQTLENLENRRDTLDLPNFYHPAFNLERNLSFGIVLVDNTDGLIFSEQESDNSLVNMVSEHENTDHARLLTLEVEGRELHALVLPVLVQYLPQDMIIDNREVLIPSVDMGLRVVLGIASTARAERIFYHDFAGSEDNNIANNIANNIVERGLYTFLAGQDRFLQFLEIEEQYLRENRLNLEPYTVVFFEYNMSVFLDSLMENNPIDSLENFRRSLENNNSPLERISFDDLLRDPAFLRHRSFVAVQTEEGQVRVLGLRDFIVQTGPSWIDDIRSEDAQILRIPQGYDININSDFSISLREQGAYFLQNGYNRFAERLSGNELTSEDWQEIAELESRESSQRTARILEHNQQRDVVRLMIQNRVDFNREDLSTIYNRYNQLRTHYNEIDDLITEIFVASAPQNSEETAEDFEQRQSQMYTLRDSLAEILNHVLDLERSMEHDGDGYAVENISLEQESNSHNMLRELVLENRDSDVATIIDALQDAYRARNIYNHAGVNSRDFIDLYNQEIRIFNGEEAIPRLVEENALGFNRVLIRGLISQGITDPQQGLRIFDGYYQLSRAYEELGGEIISFLRSRRGLPSSEGEPEINELITEDLEALRNIVQEIIRLEQEFGDFFPENSTLESYRNEYRYIIEGIEAEDFIPTEYRSLENLVLQNLTPEIQTMIIREMWRMYLTPSGNRNRFPELQRLNLSEGVAQIQREFRGRTLRELDVYVQNMARDQIRREEEIRVSRRMAQRTDREMDRELSRRESNASRRIRGIVEAARR